jgi:hypothetical protein
MDEIWPLKRAKRNNFQTMEPQKALKMFPSESFVFPVPAPGLSKKGREAAHKINLSEK